MRRMLVLLIVTLGAGVLVAPAHADSANHYVTGNFFRPSAVSGFCLRTAYVASTDASGNASGSIEINRYPCDSAGNVTGQASSTLRGTVTCLDVTGQHITFAGPITQGTGIFQGRTRYQEESTDNATPSSPSNPDTDLTTAFTGGTPSCPPSDNAQVPIISGDIRIVR